MKYITSTTGKKILFNLTSEKKLVIDTVVPIQLAEEEFKILKSRLGGQIHEHNMENETPTTVETPVVSPEAAPEVIPEPETTETPTAPEAPAEGTE